jgi:Methyltransferase domain
VIDDRLADELERIGVEGRASILAEFAASSRVASHQIPEIIGGARRNNRHRLAPGFAFVCGDAQSMPFPASSFDAVVHI